MAVNGIYNNDMLLTTTLRNKYSQLTTPAVSPAEQQPYIGEPTSITGPNLFASGTSGEVISNYGSEGAFEGAYKGIKGPVGQNFDSLRDLGIYGF